jgi:hypothetical protein
VLFNFFFDFNQEDDKREILHLIQIKNQIRDQILCQLQNPKAELSTTFTWIKKKISGFSSSIFLKLIEIKRNI